MREILFIAGEASGDSHASGVVKELVARRAPYSLVGVGGDQMRTAGVELIEHTKNLAVMGFVAPVQMVLEHLRLFRALKRRLRSGRVAAVVLVDYPDFNMLVARAAKAAGVPVLYYITPQVWAWRKNRLAALARTVTKAAVILPFEEPLLREHGIDATFVGHPLLDRAESLPDRAAARAALGVAPDARVLALFPGSRKQEIRLHLDVFVAAANELERRIPGLEVVVSAAPHVTIDPARCPYRIVSSASFTVLSASDAAMGKSGTTTLEAAVAGCPLIVAYRTGSLDYAIARRVVQIPRIGLVNVVAGRSVAPELIQDALTPGAAADALEPLLDPASAVRARMLEDLAEVRRALGEPGAARRVADILVSLVAGDRTRGTPEAA